MPGRSLPLIVQFRPTWPEREGFLLVAPPVALCSFEPQLAWLFRLSRRRKLGLSLGCAASVLLPRRLCAHRLSYLLAEYVFAGETIRSRASTPPAAKPTRRVCPKGTYQVL